MVARTLSLFAVLAAALAAWPADDKPAAKPESLRDYVKRNEGRFAYGMYIGDKKAGWILEETRLGEHDGKPAAVLTAEMLLSATVLGTKTVMNEKSVTYYSLEGEGPIVAAEKRSVHDGKETRYSVARKGTGLAIKTTGNGQDATREVPVPKDTLLLQKRLEDWLKAGPKAGATFEVFSASWDEDEVDSKQVYHYRGRQAIVWSGLPVDVFDVEVDLKGARFAAQLRPDGRLLSGKIGGLLDVRMEEEKLAKKLDGPAVDLLSAAAIFVDKDLGDAEDVDALTLELTGLGDFKLPESHRQRVAERRGDAVMQELTRDGRAGSKQPLSEAQRAEHLKATPTLQSDHPRLIERAKRVTDAVDGPLAKAKRLERWVYEHLKKSYGANANTALAVLENAAGDCTEHTLLFVTLARAAGIPAREVGGVAFVNARGRPLFGWHAWAEVHDGEQWVSVDPTWDEFYVDATHIKFSEGSQDGAWMNVLGRVKVKVLKVAKRKE
jgi:hypothetical protein